MAQIIIDDAELQAALSKLAARCTNLTPPLSDLGESLLRSTRKRFDKEVDPLGKPWKPLAKSTIRAKRRRAATGKPYRTRANPLSILKDTFTLRDSITYQVSGNTLSVGTNIEYGIHHQLGKPRREFLGLDSSDRAEAEAIFADYLLEGL